MMVTEIINRVLSVVQDPSYTNQDILDLINEGRWEIAGEVDLPLLRATAEVTTTTNASSVALPEDYHKGLFWVGSARQNRRIGARKGDYHNLITFMERYPTRALTCPIIEVCVDGSNLLYQGSSADTLTIEYFKKIDEIPMPSTPVNPNDLAEPVEITDHLQKPLLVAYCCKEIFSWIEDGLEGQKINTMFWESSYQRSIAKLRKFIDESKPRETKQVRDVS